MSPCILPQESQSAVKENKAAYREKPRNEAETVFWNIPCPGSDCSWPSWVAVLPEAWFFSPSFDSCASKSSFYLIVGFLTLVIRSRNQHTYKWDFPWGQIHSHWKMRKVSEASAVPQFLCDHAEANPRFRTARKKPSWWADFVMATVVARQTISVLQSIHAMLEHQNPQSRSSFQAQVWEIQWER